MFSASVSPCIQRRKTRQAKGKTKMMNIVILQSLTDWEELVSCAYSASGSLLSSSDGESLTACSPVQETHSEWELRPGKPDQSPRTPGACQKLAAQTHHGRKYQRLFTLNLYVSAFENSKINDNQK